MNAFERYIYFNEYRYSKMENGKEMTSTNILKQEVEEYIQKDKEGRKLKEDYKIMRRETKKTKKDYIQQIIITVKKEGIRMKPNCYYIIFDEFKRPKKCKIIKGFGYVNEGEEKLKKVLLFYNEDNKYLHLIYTSKTKQKSLNNNHVTYCDILNVLAHLYERKLKQLFNKRVLE